MSVKDVIARCIGRMRNGACATCDNRALCPAGQWQRVFPVGPKEKTPRGDVGAFLTFLADTIRGLTQPAAEERCLRKTVENAIEPLLGSGEVTIELVARQLGMSRQTLYRRLREEGVTFQEVLEAKRRQLAIRYLGFDRMPAKAVAYKLGFSDPAAFSRAFKRWTGLSPSEFKMT